MQILSISPGHKTNRSRKICDPQLGRANSSSFSRIATTPFCFLSLCSCTFMRSANAATLNRCCRSHVFLAVVQLVAQFGSQSSHVCVACQSMKMCCATQGATRLDNSSKSLNTLRSSCNVSVERFNDDAQSCAIRNKRTINTLGACVPVSLVFLKQRPHDHVR